MSHHPQNPPRRLLLLLLSLVLLTLSGAAAAATAPTHQPPPGRALSRPPPRKLAGDNNGGDKAGGKKQHGGEDETTTTTYPPSHTLTVTKRGTVSLSEFARDPDAGPWRPDDMLKAAASSSRSSRRPPGGLTGEPKLRGTPVSDAELLASIPPSVRKAALAEGDEDDENHAADGDADEEEEEQQAEEDEENENDALPSKRNAKQTTKKQKHGGPKHARIRAFDAIDAFEATFALDSGGGTSFEPPDSAVAVGNGLVGVAVNSVVTFYRASDGRAVSSPIPARDVLGIDVFAEDPYLLDPSLAYDPQVGRWFYTVARLSTDDRGAFTGGSSLEVAVSGSADPFAGELDDGLWSVYSIPSTNTGEDGTLPVPACIEAGSCLADYGQMRVSGAGFWLSANVVQFFAGEEEEKKLGSVGEEEEQGEGGVIGASVYALSKFALADGAFEIVVAQWYLDALAQDGGRAAFTVMPALTADPWSYDDEEEEEEEESVGVAADANDAVDDTKQKTTNNNNQNDDLAHFMSTPYSRARDYLIHYVISGGRVLRDADATPEDLQDALLLSVSRVPVPNPWPLLPLESRDVWQPQRGYPFPLGQKLDEPRPGKLGGPDSRIMGLALAQGRLVAVYSVLKPQKYASGADNKISNNPNAPSTTEQLFTAVAWAQVDVGGGGGKNKKSEGDVVGGGKTRTEAFGTIDAKGADVVYPNVALAASGKGGVGAILTGRRDLPSAVVVPFSVKRGSGGAGKLRVSGRGKGVQDGASQYYGFPRFGDYSGSAVEYGLWEGEDAAAAAKADAKATTATPTKEKGSSKRASTTTRGGAVWFSCEYIASSCTLAEYEGGGEDEEDPCPVNTCGCSRAEFANYATRVTRLVVA